MGVDACIYFKTKEGKDPTLCHNFEGEKYPKIVESPDWAPKEATHEVDNWWRYYGPGYERGPWPKIAEVLMELFASEDVEKVWYMGDCDDTEKEFTKEEVLYFTAQYMLHGDRPYRSYFES